MAETRRSEPRNLARRTIQRHTVVRIVQSGGGRRARTDGTLALAPDRTSWERRRPRLSVVGTGASPPRELAEAIVRLVIEVLAGTRPPRQLAERAVPDVWHGLAVHQVDVADAPIAPPKLLRTWLQKPSPGAVETGAVVLLDGHVHALALRLERQHGNWRCTALETTVPAKRRPGMGGG